MPPRGFAFETDHESDRKIMPYILELGEP
jgi:hypothetical protein